jgi:hypothetical protein
LEEQTFVVQGLLHRPFSQSAGVKNHGYSSPLQRCLTDFGADESFAYAVEKVKEHYGITIPVSAVQRITEYHAGKMLDQESLATEFPDGAGAAFIIVEADGSMIPVVTITENTGNTPSDKRRCRSVQWQEARLTLAHQSGSVTPFFGATMDGTDSTGDHMLNVAILAGGSSHSTIHCLGDGAPWIAGQCDRVYGAQGHYLIDFFHLCDYLAAAAPGCQQHDATAWLDEQKRLMKTGQVMVVIQNLKDHLEQESVPDKDAPVRLCHRYLINRTGQFEYAKALDAGLPIGSGEIESAHRYIIQKRLKIAGAWWKRDNARKMLALRTLRANGAWQKYWNQKNLLAA